MSSFNRRIRDERGFNLIELMIVIAIIGILIGVGTLAWGAMVKSGNETAAIQTLSRIGTFQGQYATSHKGNFGTFEQLVQSTGLDEQFLGDSPVVNGYIFRITVVESANSQPAKYEVTAEPQVPTGASATGNRYFYTSSAIGSIKASDSGPANDQSPSI